MTQKIFNKKGFTLIELLVVVLIIGILAAIAVPKYQKAVLKADLHRGVPLVESLYQAQQAYFLATGDFAADIDLLDLSFAKDNSCQKTSSSNTSYYDCDFGRIYNDKRAYIRFHNQPSTTENKYKRITYAHYFKDSGDFKAGKRYCFAGIENETAQDVCKGMGGKEISISDTWIYYELP